MADIVDYTARENTTILETQMFKELKVADVDAAQITFNKLKAFCSDQAKRVGNLIAVVINKYKTTDPRRYEPFEQMKDIERSGAALCSPPRSTGEVPACDGHVIRGGVSGGYAQDRRRL